MKIYISEKDIEENNLNFVEEDFKEEYFMVKGMSDEVGFEEFGDVGIVTIESLEQHDKELLQDFKQKIIAEYRTIEEYDTLDNFMLSIINQYLKERGV